MRREEHKILSYLAGITDMRAYIKTTNTYTINLYFSKDDMKIALATKNMLSEFEIQSKIYYARRTNIMLSITNLNNIHRYANLIIPYTLKKSNMSRLKELGIYIQNKKPHTIFYLTAIVDLMAFPRWDREKGIYAVRINFTEKEEELFEIIRSMFEELGFKTKIYETRKNKGNFKEKQIYIPRKHQVERFLSIFKPLAIQKERFIF